MGSEVGEFLVMENDSKKKCVVFFGCCRKCAGRGRLVMVDVCCDGAVSEEAM